jgi:hypothetical protein
MPKGSTLIVDDFEINVFRFVFDRQIDITAFESLGGVLLNSKNEFFTPKIVLPVFRQQ